MTLNSEVKDAPEKDRLNGHQRLQEALFIVGLVLSIFTAIALLSFNPADPSWSQTAWNGDIHNSAGELGAWVADTLFFAFGFLAYTFPIVILVSTWSSFRKRGEEESELDLMVMGTRLLGFILLFLTSCALADTSFDDLWYFSSGGVVGDVLTSLVLPTLDLLSSTILFLFLWAAGFTLFTGISWLSIVDRLGAISLEGIRRLVNKSRNVEDETYQAAFENELDSSHQSASDIEHHRHIESRREPQFDSSKRDSSERYETPKISSNELSDDITWKKSALTEEEIQYVKDDSASFSAHSSITQTQTAANAFETRAIEAASMIKSMESRDTRLTEKSMRAVADSTPSQSPKNIRGDSIIGDIEESGSLEKSDIAISTLIKESAELSMAKETLNDDRVVDSDLIVDSRSDSSAISNAQSVTHIKPEVTSDGTSSTMFTFAEDDSLGSMKEAGLAESEYPQISSQDSAPLSQKTTLLEQENNVHSDADIAAFQAMVAKEKATKAALQNPFLIQPETNLPKPTEPFPTLDLLYSPDSRAEMESQESLERTARLVEAKLADYKIKARVVGIFPGPVITRYELDLAPGVKVSRISGLAMDLARSLSAMAVRVVEVIPGKPYVGLELPNFNRQTVFFSDVVGSPIFKDAASPTTVVLGEDISGDAVIADLAKMPHVLVAGTTGSGKSVGVNVMILSILYKATPEDVRFIMIDPKMLELSIYEGIPHLLSEVVTDMKDAGNALRWCVGEMERRYKLMSALGVRNLQGFNDKLKMAAAAGHPIYDPFWKEGDSMDETPPLLEKLPSIVVIVDEFADLMMVVGKKVEELIARLAQKARAAGIHLILATQRPSVDVITGLIKANIPTRVAFTVSTKTDSRTILDQGGAESLLGMGDMLYLAPGSNHTIRVHGAFASDDDVHAVVNDWKARGKPNYIDEITKSEQSSEALLPGEKAEGEEELDQLFDQVVEFVTTSRRGSVSGVQRQFRIGYNRAARIVEQLEANGVVSAPGNNGNREVIAPPPVGMEE